MLDMDDDGRIVDKNPLAEPPARRPRVVSDADEPKITAEQWERASIAIGAAMWRWMLPGLPGAIAGAVYEKLATYDLVFARLPVDFRAEVVSGLISPASLAKIGNEAVELARIATLSLDVATKWIVEVEMYRIRAIGPGPQSEAAAAYRRERQRLKDLRIHFGVADDWTSE